jgi:Eukaryotic aspartyl protease
VASTYYLVNGKKFPRTPVNNEAILDTGTTLWLVDNDMCNNVYTNYIPGGWNDPENGWVFPQPASTNSLPQIEVQIGNGVISCDKRFLSYCTYTGKTKTGQITTMCYGLIQPRGNMTVDIAGDGYLRNVYSVSSSAPLEGKILIRIVL